MMQNEVVREWIEKTDEDFGFASTGFEYTDYFSQICFHFHQAAEKYLKVFIIANKLEFRPIHNLIELLDTCVQKEPTKRANDNKCRRSLLLP